MPAFPGQPDVGRWLILAGLALIVAGLVWRLAPRLPWIGNLPGDITIRRESFTFYFPLGSCLLLSLILTLILNWLKR